MGKSVSRVLAATLFAGAVGICAAPSATAAPSIYEPSITPCSHQFRTPFEPARPGTSAYWSPFGTADIVCYDAGFGVSHYQRDPGGQWHAMNQLIPGNYFINIFGYNHLPT